MDKSNSMKVQVCKVLSEFLRMTESLTTEASECHATKDNLSKEEQYLSNAFHTDFASTMGIMNMYIKDITSMALDSEESVR